MTSRSILRAIVVAACGVALVALSACVPTEKGELSEVSPEADPTELTAPEFPDGPVDAETLVEGLVFDMASRPADLSYWSPSVSEARCAAEGIVEAVGAERLSSLGYRPATPGSSLNDLGLQAAELTVVAESVELCIDLAEGAAALLSGGGRLPATAARCAADVLADGGQLGTFVAGWIFGADIDPFTGSPSLTHAMIDAANICISDTALISSELALPGGDSVLDLNRSGGQAGSPYVADQPQDPDD